MTDNRLGWILDNWKIEILEEIRSAYRDVPVLNVIIHVIRSENYMITLSVSGYFVEQDGVIRTVNVSSFTNPITFEMCPIVVDKAALEIGQYDALPVRNIIEQMHRMCNSQHVDKPVPVIPWGPRTYRKVRGPTGPQG